MVLEKNITVLLLAWYDFSPEASILCIEEDMQSISSFLARKDHTVESVKIRDSAKDTFADKNYGKYDYIVAAGILEKCRTPKIVLEKWNSLLNENGTLLLATPNRLGIQFFCGDRDPFTHNAFDGIENYLRVPNPLPKAMGGRLYARSEMEFLLEQAGFCRRKFYSVYPNLLVPQLLYAEGYLPNEDLDMRIIPRYYDRSAVFMNERHLYDTLVQNGLFHQMANAYFIECPKKKAFSAVRHVTLPVFRSEESFVTIIRDDMTVEKRILSDEGLHKLKRMQENAADLRAHGIKTVGMTIEGNSLIMPYIEAPSAVYHLRDLMNQNQDAFVEEMDRFRDIIVQSSDHTSGNGNDAVLKRGYLDLVPINAFYQDNGYVFYDQEFCCENLPARVIIWRFVDFVYDSSPQLNALIPIQFFLARYGIDNADGIVHDYIAPFMNGLLNKKDFEKFNKKTEPSYNAINRNYQYINSGFANESELLKSCFEDLKDKKLFVFGAGKYADKFLAFYRDEYAVSAVLDNDAGRQGDKIRGLGITSPDILSGLNPDEYKVIICTRQYRDILAQLRDMGTRHIGLYSAGHIYPGLQATVHLQEASRTGPQKKYRIGYVAGVFDLYHLGHLNMFRRAKEQCGYLVVGVTSDRYVREGKKREPFIPFEERLEMVRSCRYVDEAHEIPFEYGGTVEAFQKYHFDVQFSGSDYINHPWWLEQQKWLREHGADLVFFPYTEQTSSTKIKALIEKGLL